MFRLGHTIEDLKPVTELMRALDAEGPWMSPRELSWHQNRGLAHGVCENYGVLRDGHLVGYLCLADQWRSAPSEQVVFWLNVHPAWQGQGIGRQLFQRLLDRCQALQRKHMTTFLSEGRPRDVRCVEAAGFKRLQRAERSRVSLYDPLPVSLSNEVQRLSEQDIRIVDAVGLKESYPGDWLDRWAGIYNEVMADVPRPTPWREQTVDDLRESFEHPGHEPAFWHFAMTQGELVGLTALSAYEGDPRYAAIVISGTARSFRRRGIARGLKVHSLMTARGRGIETVITENEENNPTFKLNLELGFRPGRATLVYGRAVGPTSSELV